MLGASFFFNRGEDDLNSTRLVFSTIAYQLARYHPSFFEPIVEAVKAYVTPGMPQAAQFEVDNLIIQPLFSASRRQERVVAIFDAVDECTEKGQKQIPLMLQLLLKIATSVRFPFRVLITTRPELHIEDALQSDEYKDGAEVFTLHDIPRKQADADISLYIQTSLQRISHGSWLLKFRPGSVEDLTTCSEGLFIFARIAIDFLGDQREGIVNAFDALPRPGQSSIASSMVTLSQLDKLYDVVLKTALPEGADFLQPPDARLRMGNILGCFAILQDQVSPAAMAAISGYSVQDVRGVLSRLSSIIIMRGNDDPVRPLHATFLQYLIDPARCHPNYSVEPSLHQNRTATSCLTLLNKHPAVRRNPCDLEDPTVPKVDMQNLRQVVDEKIPTHVQYACLHWATHLFQTAHSDELEDLLATFCDSRLLLWLEALSLLGRLDLAVHALLHALSWTKVCVNPPNRSSTWK